MRAYHWGSARLASARRPSSVHCAGSQQPKPRTHDEVHVDVIHAQSLEALVQALFDARVVRRPRLGHDVDVLATDARGKGLLETLADLGLIAVAVGAVDELVAVSERVGDGRLDLAGLGLPRSWIFRLSNRRSSCRAGRGV